MSAAARLGPQLASDAEILADLRRQGQVDLVPARPSTAPDYFCTWNVQGFAASCDLHRTREAMTEASMFGSGPLQGWLGMYVGIRADLTFVMDDSWDVSLAASRTDSKAADSMYGSLLLAEDRFPGFAGDPATRLARLGEAVRSRGWRGLGGWVCAQEAPALRATSMVDYWSERLRWMRDARFDYWKVDWGLRCKDLAWRRELSRLARDLAPGLVVEHAMDDQAVRFADAFRTYDVENINAVAPTIRRTAHVLALADGCAGAGIVNCEDEPYIAAGLGCAIGVMRHPLQGGFPDGSMDRCFPPVGRDLKRRLDEVERGVRWHRIAEPFAGDELRCDGEELEDHWTVRQEETWNRREESSRYAEAAPARVSRGLPLCTVVPAAGSPRPFVLASRYPNGAIAVAAIGRTLDRAYHHAAAEVGLAAGSFATPIGIFGSFTGLRISGPIPAGRVQVLAQDLCATRAMDITARVQVGSDGIVVPGSVIDEVGCSAATPGDGSEPGLVLRVVALQAGAT